MRVFVILVLLMPVVAAAQAPQKQYMDNGIYITAADYLTINLSMAFNSPEASFKTERRCVLAVKKNDSLYRFYQDEVWGFRRNGRDWRLFGGQAYLVEKTGKIYIYSFPGTDVSSVSEWKYFSKKVDTPLYSLSKNNLAIVFHADSSFVNKLDDMPLLASIFRKDKNSHNYIFIDWITQNGIKF